jgi:hypothetical protein
MFFLQNNVVNLMEYSDIELGVNLEHLKSNENGKYKRD